MNLTRYSLTHTLGVILSLTPAVVLAQQPNFTVYATGLNGPRGLRFGSDGSLYVAEAGSGGTNAGAACPQVPPPVGPYTGGKTARISKITKTGTVAIVASGFPSTMDSLGDFIGVADIAFLNGTLYALVSGGGCSHGNADSPSGVAQVDTATGQWRLVANLGDYMKAHPAKYESADDFEPDGTLYGMIAAHGTLYVVEANHGQILSVSTAGTVAQIIDVSASQGHIVPTSIAERDGVFYVGNLNLFPINPQWARIQTIAPERPHEFLAPGFDEDQRAYRIMTSKAGFTTVVAVDFGPDGLLYALELLTAAGNPAPGTGKVVRVNSSGDIEDVVTGLTVPTGMTFGPDGGLYVANLGAAGPGAGQILRFSIPWGN